MSAIRKKIAAEHAAALGELWEATHAMESIRYKLPAFPDGEEDVQIYREKVEARNRNEKALSIYAEAAKRLRDHDLDASARREERALVLAEVQRRADEEVVGHYTITLNDLKKICSEIMDKP